MLNQFKKGISNIQDRQACLVAPRALVGLQDLEEMALVAISLVQI